MKAYFEKSDYELSVWEEDHFDYPFAHRHHKIEFAIVLEGCIDIGVNDQKNRLHQGEAVVLKSGDIHYYDAKNTNVRLLILIFEPDLIGTSKGWPENIKFISPFISKHQMETSELSQVKPLIYKLINEDRKRMTAHSLFTRAYLMNICGLIMRNIPSKPIDNKYNIDSLGLMQNIFEYMEKNYTEPISIETLANNFHLSPKYLSKIFNSMSNMNFRTHINTLRINQAETLIRHSKKQMTEIAFECGFNSIRTFNRVFKSIKGVIPSRVE